MIETILTLSTGENIYVYDKVFTPSQAECIRDITEQSYYRLGAVSSVTVNERQSTFFQSTYNQDDVKKLRMYESENFQKIASQHFTNLVPSRQWVNVSTHLSDYRFHTDSSDLFCKSLLVYTNTKWDADWGGETIFRNTKGEIEIAVEYKPNRVVIFNSNLSHKPALISVKSDPFRFIFVQQYNIQAG